MEKVVSPIVSIIIVGYNNLLDVERCLRALSRSTYSYFEVIICENGGDAPFRRLEASIPKALSEGQKVKIVCAPRNLGFAGGVNLAFKHAADMSAIWILNPDTEPARDALEYLVKRLAVGDCHAVGCTIVLPTGQVQSYGGVWKAVTAHANSIGFGSNPRDHQDQTDIETAQNYLNGASMFVSREFIQQVGLMREDYFLYCEEVEWFLRAQQKNIKIGFSNKARILHYHGTTTGFGSGIYGASKLAMYLSERNRLLVIWDTSPKLILSAACASLVRLIARCLRHRALHQLSPGLQGWWAGIHNHRKLRPPFSDHSPRREFCSDNVQEEQFISL